VEENLFSAQSLPYTWKNLNRFLPRCPWSKTTVSCHRENGMAVQLLSAAERHRANRFPNAITDEDLITFFTLSEEDQKQIPVHAGPHARLGFGLELCALRFMGFVPDDLTSAPPEAVTFVAQQLTVEPEALAHYTGSTYTRMHHPKPFRRISATAE
jgi:uncharacterized protein DUF4158